MAKRQAPRRAQVMQWPCTNRRNLAGRRYGRLSVQEMTERRAINGAVVWRCLCRCGRTCEVISTNLGSGNTRSCGCLQADKTREAIRRRIASRQ